jgi:hypothetical protein
MKANEGIRIQAEAGLAVTIMVMQMQQRELLHDRLQGWRMTRAGCQYLQLEWWIHWEYHRMVAVHQPQDPVKLAASHCG